MKIAFDFDDTIVDIDTLLVKELSIKYGATVDNPRKKLHMTFPDELKGTASKIVHRELQNLNLKFKPLRNSDKWLKMYYSKYKVPIKIITARPEFMRRTTEKWLDVNLPGIPHDVTFTNGSQYKHRYLNDIDYLVDDNVDVVNKAADICKKVFLIKQPWNKDVVIKSNVIRVFSIKDAFDYLGI